MSCLPHAPVLSQFLENVTTAMHRVWAPLSVRHFSPHSSLPFSSTTRLKLPQAKVTSNLLAAPSHEPTPLFILLDFLEAFHIIGHGNN